MFSDKEEDLILKGKTVRTVTIKDPITRRVLCKIKDPKHTINGYPNSLNFKPIDIPCFIRDMETNPDFGLNA